MEEYVINLIGSSIPNKFNLTSIKNPNHIGNSDISMVLEAVVIIIPSELILAIGGILAANGTFTLGGAIVVGLIGSVFCASIIYMIGYYGGRPFIIKYGKYFFMKEKDIEKSDKWFQKYGMSAALIGRFFPIVRTLISLPIGISKLNFKRFLIYTTIGSVPWTVLFVLSGFYLGNNYTKIVQIMDIFKNPIVILFIVLFIIYIYYKILKPKFIIFKIKSDD